VRARHARRAVFDRIARQAAQGAKCYSDLDS